VLCPVCKSKRIRFFGAGTERIEEAVKEILPGARVLRWDADTTARKGSHEQIMAAFANHQADILIGTQMIAKGLDLPLVTLVGVVAADTGLFLPDFRASERSFQLLTQVAGRAGRSQRGGRVVIQSYRPEHYVIQAAAQHDYQGFYARELAFRREHGYPPVRKLARLIYWEKRLERMKAETSRMAAVLHHRLMTMGLEGAAAGILGPAPAFFERHRGYYRWQLLLRAPDPPAVLRGVDFPFGWRVDVDPLSTL
jgi:primosomal protein N' (replication factor Y)